MTKWDAIRLISEKGRALGIDGALGLLEWCDKPNTAAVTDEEATAYYELLCQKEQVRSRQERYSLAQSTGGALTDCNT